MIIKEKIEDFINDDGFYKIYSRNSSLYVSECFGFHAKKYLNSIYNISWDEIAVNNNEFVDVYGLKKQKEEVSRRILEKISSSTGIKDFYEDFALVDFDKYRTITKQLNEKYKNESIFSQEEIIADFRNFNEIYARFIAHNYFVFFTDEPLNHLLEEKLREYFSEKNEQEIVNLIQLISTPLRKTAVVLERISFLGLKIKQVENPDESFQKAIEEHTQKYNWFPIYNPSDDVYSAGYYEKKLNEINLSDAADELAILKNTHLEHKEQYLNLINSITDRSLRKIIEVTNGISFYREYRNDVRREGLRDIQNLFKKIATNLNLSVKDLSYMQRREIMDSLVKGESIIDKSSIEKRIKSFIVLFSEKSVVLDSQSDISELKQLITIKNQNKKSLDGIVGSKGFAKGKVVVVDNIKKLSQVEEGDILVASMTAPDYVPAMRKSVAVITDEGGITCHAAIVARELNIPCIIGTKFATKVLKDGDLVEVDANNGTIIIL